MTRSTPPLIVADEPTAALDTECVTRVMGLLRKIARERNSAVVTVTHDHRMIEGFESVSHMKDGRFVDPAQGRALRGADY